MKKLLKLTMLICICIFAFSTCVYASFNDIEGHWCEDEINEFKESNFVEGYEDNTFRPDNGITKSEFCKIVNSYMGYEVSGDWQVSNLNLAKEKGYLTNGNIDDLISREEAFVVLSRVMQLDTSLYENTELKYKDTSDISVWARPAVEALTVSEYVVGYEDEMLKPKDNMTRAELVKVLYEYVGIGGLDEDIEDVEFAIGYMKTNKFGLEFIEVKDSLTLKIDDAITLASVISEEDGDVEFKIILGEELVEFEKENLHLQAKKEGTIKVEATTTKSNKTKNMMINVEK